MFQTNTLAYKEDCNFPLKNSVKDFLLLVIVKRAANNGKGRVWDPKKNLI